CCASVMRPLRVTNDRIERVCSVMDEEARAQAEAVQSAAAYECTTRYRRTRGRASTFREASREHGTTRPGIDADHRKSGRLPLRDPSSHVSSGLAGGLSQTGCLE